MTVANYGASDTIRLGARVTNAGTTSQSGYYVAISSTGVWTILRIDAGLSTTLATGPTQPLAAGRQDRDPDRRHRRSPPSTSPAAAGSR